MDLGVLLESPLGVSPRLEWGHARALTSQAVSAVSRFPSRGSRDLFLYLEPFPRGFPSRLSHEAFPRGFPTGLSHVPPWCDSILGLKVEAVQGKQVSLELTETSGGLWEWWHDLEFLSPLLFRAPPLEMRWECQEFFPDQVGKGSLISSYEPETELLWMCGELSCFLSGRNGYVGELLELQHDCERLFRSSRVHV